MWRAGTQDDDAYGDPMLTEGEASGLGGDPVLAPPLHLMRGAGGGGAGGGGGGGGGGMDPILVSSSAILAGGGGDPVLDFGQPAYDNGVMPTPGVLAVDDPSGGASAHSSLLGGVLGARSRPAICR